MTVREAISITKKLFREVNADSRLPNKMAYSLLLKHSRWLVQQESEKMKLSKQNKFFQTIKYIDVIEAPAVDPYCGIKSNCKVYRTADRLPTLFEDTGGVIIRVVTSIDNSEEINWITIAEWKRKIDNPWIKKLGRYVFYSDGYLYFPVDPKIKAPDVWRKVNIDGAFETDVSYMNMCDNTPDGIDQTKRCIPFMDGNFMIPVHLEGRLFDAVIKDIGGIYEKTHEKSNSINKDDNN